jgi:hypothetical protein
MYRRHRARGFFATGPRVPPLRRSVPSIRSTYYENVLGVRSARSHREPYERILAAARQKTFMEFQPNRTRNTGDARTGERGTRLALQSTPHRT